MRIQFASDIHLEFKENLEFIRSGAFKVNGDILILAGDIYYLDEKLLRQCDFFKWASDNYEQTLLIPGNHEYYRHGNIVKDGNTWKLDILSNVAYYQNEVVHINNTDIILSTLWSYIRTENEIAVYNGINDFRLISYDNGLFLPKNFNDEHIKCLSFIKQKVKESSAKNIVVVTHHVPTFKAVALHHRSSKLNDAFACELGDFIVDSPIDYWIYGHSHTNIDIEIGNTKILSNQLGYVCMGEHKQGFEGIRNIQV